MKKRSPLAVGLFNVLAPIPVLVLAFVAFSLLAFGIGIGIFDAGNVPVWFQLISFLPFLLPLLVLPVIQILGVVLGIMKRREKHGIVCIVLSVLGFAGNAVMWTGVYWTGLYWIGTLI